jgi:hypothetical protein
MEGILPRAREYVGFLNELLGEKDVEKVEYVPPVPTVDDLPELQEDGEIPGWVRGAIPYLSIIISTERLKGCICVCMYGVIGDFTGAQV